MDLSVSAYRGFDKARALGSPRATLSLLFCSAGGTDPTNESSASLFLRNVNLTLTDPNTPQCKGGNRSNAILQENSGFCMLGNFPTAQELPTLAPPSFPLYRRSFCNGDSGGPTIVQGAKAADDLLIGDHLS